MKRRSPCFECWNITGSKKECYRYCSFLERWRQEEFLLLPPVPIEQVRLGEIRQGESCLVVISEVQMVYIPEIEERTGLIWLP